MVIIIVNNHLDDDHHRCHNNHDDDDPQVLHQAREMGRGQGVSSLWHGRQLQGQRSQVRISFVILQS